MNSEDILARLKANEAALRARGDNRPNSDIDIMIEIEPEGHVGVFDYAG